MIFAIPVLGWIIGWILFVSMAIPFWWFWNDLAPIYFYWLPPVYQNIPFWHSVGLFIVINILKTVLVPKLTYPSYSNPKK